MGNHEGLGHHEELEYHEQMELHDSLEYHELEQLDLLLLEYHVLLEHLAGQGLPYLEGQQIHDQFLLDSVLMEALQHQLLHLEQKLLHHGQEHLHVECLLEKESLQCLYPLVKDLLGSPYVQHLMVMGFSQIQKVQVA